MRISNWNVYSLNRTYSTSYSTAEKSTLVESVPQSEIVAIYEKGNNTSSTYENLYTYSPPRMTLSSTAETSATATDLPTTYTNWTDALNLSSDDYIDSVFTRIDQDRDGITDSEIPELLGQHYQWLEERFFELNASLDQGIADGLFTSEEALPYRDQGHELLAQLDESLWLSIENLLVAHRASTTDARNAYSNWDQSLTDLGNDYIRNLEMNIKDQSGFITDEQLNQYLQQLDQWITARSNQLSVSLDEALASTGIKDSLMDSSQTKLDIVKQRYTDFINQQVTKHNYPPKPPSPDSLFTTGKQKFEFTVGSQKASLTLRLSAGQTSSSSFYVVDAKGTKKKVMITFDNAELQREFDKRFKQSSLSKGDKTFSLEKLNSFLSSVKDSIKSISDTDLDRLKSKLYGKEESDILDKKMKKFFATLKATLLS